MTYYKLSFGSKIGLDGKCSKLPEFLHTKEELEIYKSIGLIPQELDIESLEKVESN